MLAMTAVDCHVALTVLLGCRHVKFGATSFEGSATNENYIVMAYVVVAYVVMAPWSFLLGPPQHFKYQTAVPRGHVRTVRRGSGPRRRWRREGGVGPAVAAACVAACASMSTTPAPMARIVMAYIAVACIVMA